MIGIIDYGLGNIKAFANIFKQFDVPYMYCKKAEDIQKCSKLILPGVGSFDFAMQKLEDSGMKSQLEQSVLRGGTPILGVCVGMQIMAKSSEEGEKNGLGWLSAQVKRFDESKIPFSTHLPHMGWNQVKSTAKTGLFKDLDQEAQFYFLHSYYFDNEEESDMIALANYGIPFCAAVQHNNIYGVQFHPEKSHQFGIKLLRNFISL